MSRICCRGLFAACALAVWGTGAFAADIDHTPLGDNVELITIIGDLKTGDEAKFRNLSIRYNKAVVALASDGGALNPALEIGKMIRLREFPTLVLDDYECTSACALIWLAGSKRYLAPRGRVGFHASYRDEGGRKVEGGLGNALIGRYLTLLGLPEKAVMFATLASPDEVLWLNARTKEVSGIEYELFGTPAAEPSPPPVRRPTVSTATASSRASGWVHVSSGEDIDYYLDRSRIFRVGQHIAAWQKEDHSRNTKVTYYEQKTLNYYDCTKRRSALKSATEYDRRGSVVQSFDWDDWELKWREVLPDTVGETKLEYVCAAGL